MDNNYLDLLNEQQRAAVLYKDGPSLVIAGAGSGKTRVLTYKIVDLLANGYDPRRILALTFTNKAAREMKTRIAAAAGDAVAHKLWMGTFHSMFLRILRTHADLIGFKPNFTIYDTGDSKSLIKMIIKDMDLDDKNYKASTILNIISNAKNDMVSPDAYLNDRKRRKIDEKAGRPMMAHIYEAYCRRCKLADAMDFDDILFFTNVLLRDREDIRLHYQRYFQYILVDEYQDTNFAQHLIINQLSGDEKKICVVGDDAQSIYSFRGANIANILNLKHNYPNLEIFKLERNYRSTQNIVEAANSLIRRNTWQMEKNVYSENPVGEKVSIIKSYSDYEEAYLMASIISNSKNRYRDSYEDYAILYRTNSQSRILEEALRKRNIPYRIYGGTAFYQRKEVKDAICYFRMAVNPDDDEALRRIINFPRRGIGDTTIKKAYSAAQGNNVSIWEVIRHPADFGINYNSRTSKLLADFVELIREFQRQNDNGIDAFALAQIIYNRSKLLLEFTSEETPEDVNRLENLKELLSGVKEFVDGRGETGNQAVSMSDFLSEVSLLTDQDEKDEVDGEKVTMMTVHAAKGLEFRHVMIVGLEEELFPSLMADTIEQIEEERRLLYVGITRAMETCIISYAGSRFRNGQTMLTRPSRFLREINPKYLDIRQGGKFAGSPVDNYQRNVSSQHHNNNRTARRIGTTYNNGISNTPTTRFAPPSFGSDAPDNSQMTIHMHSELSEGMQILHARFGKGVITSINADADPIIVVNFTNIGEKKLMLRFAKFQIL